MPPTTVTNMPLVRSWRDPTGARVKKDTEEVANQGTVKVRRLLYWL